MISNHNVTDLLNDIYLNLICGKRYVGFSPSIKLISLSLSLSCSHCNIWFLEDIDIILFEYILIVFIFSEIEFNVYIGEK